MNVPPAATGMGQATNGTVAGPPRPMSRQILTWVTLVVLVAAAVLGSNAFAIRDRLLGTALPDPVTPVTSRDASRSAQSSPQKLTLRSAPWYQVVTTLEGTGATTSEPFTIDSRAVDWRVTSSCNGGRLVVRSPAESKPLVDADCPEAVGHSDRNGPTSLEVSADGRWSIEIAQRIDVPLVEPPLPAMDAADTKVVAEGSFYKVDRVGAGTVTMYEQADGRQSVRLDDFWVTPKGALQLRLSSAESPRSTKEYLSGKSQLLAVMDVTAGSLNLDPPGDVDLSEFRSVVVWSPLDSRVYAAAPLEAVS